MRKKELKLVITFHTTADAMGMEQLCRKKNLPGRLIPVPRCLSAGCGLAWCADPGPDTEELLRNAADREGIDPEGFYQVMV